MPGINELKEQAITQTPLIVFECTLPTGSVERWSTHSVTIDGYAYAPRVLRHNLFEMRWGAEDASETLTRVSLTLANADSHLSQVARTAGFKGARMAARILFHDLKTGQVASDIAVVFRGLVNAPEEITESTLRLSAHNRLNLQRLSLPSLRIDRRCPWSFPANAAERQEALNGGERGKYSPLYQCGYSPDLAGGLGSLNASAPFTSCGYTRADCQARGMFDKDSSNRPTRRFGGMEFVPASVLVRGHGESGSRTSTPVANEARYNDSVPLVYGTGWIEPPVVFARNDGNLTRIETLLAAGEIESVLKVIVNGVEIPKGVAGTNMTATGWYNTVSHGGVQGGFNLEFTDGAGNPLGDPYGSMAYLAISVPNRVSDGRNLPRVQVLLHGTKLPTYDATGTYLGEVFSNNPAWVILDLLRRSGWSLDEINVPSFAQAAAFCGAPIPIPDLYGVPQMAPRFQTNLVIRRKRSVSELIRGVRTAARLYLVYGTGGLLELKHEGTLASQQPSKPAGSNSAAALAGGWPAYEFSDGSDGITSAIARRASGEPAFRIWSRPTSECPNRASVEFQDQFNEFQQDSFSLVDVEDARLVRQEVTVASGALGVPNFHQAARVLKLHLDRALRGNLFIEFETSVKGIGLKPGDLIAVTYNKEGFLRQLFRITRLAPSLNHRTVTVEAQIHSDTWYGDDPGIAGSGRVSRRQPGAGIGVPRPLVGAELDGSGQQRYAITEEVEAEGDGGSAVTLEVAFAPPSPPVPLAVDIPLISLSPVVHSAGGTLSGGQTLYYGVTAVTASGSESDLSFLVRADIPNGTATNRVQLDSLSFSTSTAAFHVYRGRTPLEMLRVASSVPVAATFTDTGEPVQLQGPPDENFDHALFEWRMEFHPETQATLFGSSTIGAAALTLMPDEFANMTVRLTAGKGAGQERRILSHSATTLTIQGTWSVTPDATSKFTITESSWNFGARGTRSPVRFTVPNRPGATVQVVGRAVNALGRDSGHDLALVTRWQVGGTSSTPYDADVPPMPSFGLEPSGQGMLGLTAVSFSSLVNTRTIFAGTLTLFYWDELASPSPISLAAPMSDAATNFSWSGPATISAGTLLQIGGEIMQVASAGPGNTASVTRASHGSNAVAHASGAPIYSLDRKVFVVPFTHEFFGSPASGSFLYPIFLPDARIAAADLIVTNGRGNSETRKLHFTATTDYGIRTLSGGQLSLQFDGHLAIQTGAVPPLIVESARSVRDIFATVTEAPTGGPIVLRLRQDEATYCELTIPSGGTLSNVVDGFGLPPLNPLARLNLDIIAVSQTWDTSPGRDLTVTIRL